MHSFTLHAVGHLVCDPEQHARGSHPYTRFCLSGRDFIDKEGGSVAREVTTILWFTAYGGLGQVIARDSRKGDQLFVEARVASYLNKETERLEHSFVVLGFRYGEPHRDMDAMFALMTFLHKS